MSRKKGKREDDKVKESRDSGFPGRRETTERRTGADVGGEDESEKVKTSKWTPELIEAAFQIQAMGDGMRSTDYKPDLRLRTDAWTWRRRDSSERKGDLSAYISNDTYLTGRLETEPDTIKAFRIQWEKKPQRAFTEKGQDSYVFVGRHSRGFILTVYPTRLVDTTYGAHAYHT